MKLNRILSAAAAAILFLSRIPALSAAAATAGDDGELSDGTFTYELNDGAYTIVECDKTAILTQVPDMRNGYPIVAIADQAFIGCTYISELSIPDTVKSIGSYAFAGCSSLKTVDLPDTLKEIPDGAFDGCSALTEVTIPEGVESIGMIAFANCSLLESVELPESLISIGENAFESCGSLKEVNIPSGVSEIGNMAFISCYSLEKITAEGNSSFAVENNVLYDAEKTRIYRAAAHNIDENFYIPETVTTVMDGAFSYCTELTNLFVPSSVTTIGQGAFLFCTSLSSIDFSEGATGLKEIGASAFANCISLKSLSLPTTLQTIGEGAFYNASGLERVIITDNPDVSLSIEAGAFSICDSLKKIIVPQSVSNIGEYAFGYTLNSDGTGYVQLDGFSMSVNSGSAAEKYAKQNDIEYTVVDRSIKKVAFVIVGVGLLLAAAVFALVLMRRGRKLAPAAVRKAESAEKEENDPNYESIVQDDDDTDQ